MCRITLEVHEAKTHKDYNDGASVTGSKRHSEQVSLGASATPPKILEGAGIDYTPFFI